PLVSTSPTGTPPFLAGIPGLNTSIVFGGGQPNEPHSGGRITLGLWLDPEQRFGIEGSFFTLDARSRGVTFASSGDPILARPYFDTVFAIPAAEVVAFPGIAAGGLNVSTSTELLGTDALLRWSLSSTPGTQWGILTGYRYLRLRDTVNINEDV